MPLHSCDLCNYYTTRFTDFKRHLQTKKHRNNCDSTNETSKDLMGMSQKEPKMSQNEPQMSQNEPVKTHKCEYCDESFSTIANKRRHELHRCKENPDLNNDLIKQQKKEIKLFKKEMEKQRKEMEKQKKEMTKQIELLLTKVGNNYTINNNNTNNIQLNNYGSEDLSHISDSLKTYLIKHPFGAIQQLIEKIHFNRDKPENTNIMITNKRDNKISVYENGKWVYRNKKKTILSLIDNKYYILDDHYNDTPHDKLSAFNHNNYKKFSSQYDENEKQLLDKLYEETEIIILNQ